MIQATRQLSGPAALRCIARGWVFLAVLLILRGLISDGLGVSIHPVGSWVPTDRIVPHSALPKGIENWGLDSAGFSMSVTLEKEVFVLGEPLTLWLVSKNISGEERAANSAFVSGLRQDIALTVLDVNGEPVAVNPAAEAERPSGGRIKAITSICRAGMAIEESINIAPVFQLKPGHTYYVNATKKVMNLKPLEIGYVTSGNAKFSIIAPTPTPRLQPPVTNVAVAATIPVNPKRMGITLPLPTPRVTNARPMVRAAAFSGGTAQQKSTPTPVATGSDSASRGQQSQLAVVSPTAEATSRKLWGSLFAIALTGLIAAILLNATRRKRATGNSSDH